ALGAGALRLGTAADVFQVQAAAEHGLHVALFARLHPRAVHEVAHAGIAREVQRDVVLRLAPADAQVARQAERAHAVHQAEVDRLGGAAFVAADLVDRAPEHFRRGGAVDVGTGLEGGHQAGIPGDVGHDPELDLRVVAGHDLAPRGSDERGADAAPVLGADRDVLQVGIARREAPGGGAGLLVAGVQAAGLR